MRRVSLISSEGKGTKKICGLAPIYFALSMIEARAGSTIGYGQWTDGASSVSFAGVVFY